MKITAPHPFLALLAFFAGTTALFAQAIEPTGDPLPSAGSMGGGMPAGDVVVGGVGAPSPSPEAPGVATTIESINFDQNTSNTGLLQIPPDPIGAAGPNHVVAVVNSSIRWHTKAGVQQNNQSLAAFFAAVSPVNATFDPKVLYDSQAGRFVVVTLERRDTANGDAVNSSRILVAVSDDSDPNGTWFFLAINSLINISGADRWADYPGFAVDEEAIYITNNMFGFGGGSFAGVRLWIINKTPLYSGGAGAFTVQNPFAGGGAATTAQPAQIVGTPPAGATGTWLVSYSGLTNGTDEFIQAVRVDNPLTAPTFNVQQLNVGNIDNTAGVYNNAPQSGSAQLINTNDRRAINAVWRNNRLYTAATTIPNSGANAGQVTSRFWELNTTTLAAISQVQSGEIGGEDIAAGSYTFFPSIAVNSGGDLCIGFAASAATIFPGAYAVVRLAGDTPGTVRPVLTVAAGTDFYYRAFGGTRNRWGDYSGTTVDPANDSDFWIFNEYAMTRGTIHPSFPTEDGRWATRWAKIDVAAQTPTLTAPATASTHSTSVPVNFNLPETALAGSVTLAFTGPATRTLTLAGSQESSGAHSFSFNPASPVGGAVASISGGASIPNGTYTVTLSYSDTFSNGPATATTTNVTIDTTTQTPTLTAPATNAIVGNPIGVSFSLPEAALGASVKLIFSGAASRTLTLAPSQETSGPHSFSFNPANPTLAPQVAGITGGASIPDGVYTITLSYQDALGNAAATAASTNVTVDTITQPPTLTAPATNAIVANPIGVSFSLPESAQGGSVQFLFTGAASRTLTLAGTQESAGPHSFNFNPANPTLAPQVAGISGGASIPDGVYTVTLSYQDVLGNPAATAASTNVRIDTTPPTLNLPAPITVTATSPAGATVNYTASASDPGGSGVASFSSVPISGSTFPIGTTPVNATATDNAGNIANGSFNVTVNPNPPPTGGTFAFTPNVGVHQGDSLNLVASGWTDPDLPLSYRFFLDATPLNLAGPATSLGINAPAPGSYTLKVRVTDSAGSFTEATQPLTVVVFTPIETWRQTFFGDYHNTGNQADLADFEPDGVINLLEFAFGTDPTSNLSGPPDLQYTGTFAGGGAVTLTGRPITRFESIVNGIDFRALFVRRVDFVAAGLTYIVEFSPDNLSPWVASGAVPTVLANNGTVQIVSVPYLRFVAGKKAHFFRVRVIISP